MQKPTIAALACLSLALGACSGLETVSEIYKEGGEKAVEATATALNIECTRSLDRRKTFVNDVNARQAERGKTPRAIAQDCNGDGASDF